jgi:hypothetical protein
MLRPNEVEAGILKWKLGDASDLVSHLVGKPGSSSQQLRNTNIGGCQIDAHDVAAEGLGEIARGAAEAGTSIEDSKTGA